MRSKKIAPQYQFFFDAIGFSRGAAQARYFVHEVLSDEFKKRLEYALKSPVTIKVLFVGLFDTVSADLTDGTHKDDVSDLKLDAISKVKGEVFHICAADEFRENFPLTNIKSAIQAGVGFEISLPGAHSDIGGGYHNDISETTVTISNIPKEVVDLDRKWLIDQGYAANDQQIITRNTGEHTVVGGKIIYFYKNELRRKKLLSHYSFIPLRLMIKRAIEKGGFIFTPSEELDAEYKITGHDVQQVQKLIYGLFDKAVRDNNKNPIWSQIYKIGKGGIPKFFKMQYIHYSANEEWLSTDTYGKHTNWLQKKLAIRRRKIFDG